MMRRSHDDAQRSTPREQTAGYAGHGWMMIACCIPMLVIVIALVATGVVGVGFIFVALACTAMIAIMHGGMSHEGGGTEKHR